MLANDDFIFIYNNTSNLQAYCYYSKERDMVVVEDMSHICHWNMQEVTPATKEQRAILFAKMKEIGYEWDADKKELKKIENKPNGGVKRGWRWENNDWDDNDYYPGENVFTDLMG